MNLAYQAATNSCLKKMEGLTTAFKVNGDRATGDKLDKDIPLHMSANNKSLALTEYASNPSPHSPHNESTLLPADYLLPNGTPDVSLH